MSGAARAAAALLVAAVTAAAHGHAADKSFSSWQVDADGADVVVRLRTAELARVPGDTTPEAYLATNLLLSGAGGHGAATTPVEMPRAPSGWSIFRWRVSVEGPSAIESRLFDDGPNLHLHFARVTTDGGAERQRVLSARDPVWTFGGADAGASLGGYVGLGIEHILAGWDHLAFVVALLLLAASLREVAMLVTGFTIAHSLTLGLATLGMVRPEAAAVEIVIGLSIALVAAENCWLLSGRGRRIPRVALGALLAAAALALLGIGSLAVTAWLGLALFAWCHFRLLRATDRPARLRAVLTFAFGLAHGLGFAGVLMEFELPPGTLVAALLGFNAGVELGQLAVVAVVFPLLAVLARMAEGRWHRLAAEAGSAALCGLGLFWVVVRTLG